MSRLSNNEIEYGLDMAKGLISGKEVIHKFGKNAAVGTSFVTLSAGGVYMTPQVSGATTLRIKAGGNAADTAAGAGAREVTLEGLDATGAYITETLTTAGASASEVTSKSFLRLFRFRVTASGTYATMSTGSHGADIVIENGGGGTNWGTILKTGIGASTSQVGMYTVPLGKEAYITSVFLTVDSTKAADVMFFERENILETAAPYSAAVLGIEFKAIVTPTALKQILPRGPFPALTDIGFLGKVGTGTGDVAVDFEIILKDTG